MMMMNPVVVEMPGPPEERGPIIPRGTSAPEIVRLPIICSNLSNVT